LARFEFISTEGGAVAGKTPPALGFIAYPPTENLKKRIPIYADSRQKRSTVFPEGT